MRKRSGVQYIFTHLIVVREPSGGLYSQYRTPGFGTLEEPENRWDWMPTVSWQANLKKGLLSNRSSKKKTTESELVGGFDSTPLKNMLVKMGSSSPIFRGEHKKYLSCHHLVN